MSTRQKGNRKENELGALLEEHGYICFYSRGSRGIDVIAHHQDWDANFPHLAIEVGRRGKLIGESFTKLREARKCAGTRVIVARYLRKKGKRNGWWRVHVDEDTFFDSLPEALEALRAA